MKHILQLLFSRGLKRIQNIYFLLLTHTKELLLVTFCETTVGIGDGTPTGRQVAATAAV